MTFVFLSFTINRLLNTTPAGTMVSIGKKLSLLTLIIIVLTLILSNCAKPDSSSESSSVADNTTTTSDNTTTSTTDTTAPVIAEVTAVTTPTNDNTPNYTFSSDEAGTITYGGSCSSNTTSAVSGNNTITLVSLSDNTYSDCTITVTDSAGNVSSTLTITAFTVDTTAPVVAEVTVVTTPTNDSTPNYTFSSDEAGTITYGGSCSSSTTSASVGNNTITLSSLSDETYIDCTIKVTDSLGYVSNTLTIALFVVDSTAATLKEVTAVTTPTNVTTPNYTFSSSEAGTITYGGSCSSSTTSATADNNTITLAILSDNTYSDCTITVTDNSSNSVTLNISSFVIDTTAPTVYSIYPTDNQSGVSLSDNVSVTFSEAMDTTYVTTSTSDTYCAGTIRVSSDNFSNCVRMSSSPASSNSNKTFTLDPYDNLSYSTTYKTRVTTGVKDTAGNTLSNQYETSSGFTTFSETTAPTVDSVSPEDNSTNVAVSTTVAVTFSESMSTSTITTNTDNTTCTGSFQLSSNNFTTCIKMSAAPSASNSDKTFTVTPDDNLSRGTNYKIQITTYAADTSSNSLADNYTTSNGFTTFGTGTIRGTVRYDNNTAADNVSVSFALSGTIVDNATTNTSGDYSQECV